jgi:hypothetical protein
MGKRGLCGCWPWRSSSCCEIYSTKIEHQQDRRRTGCEPIEVHGLNKATVINVMNKAVALDQNHLKLTSGKRRKLYLEYVP